MKACIVASLLLCLATIVLPVRGQTKVNNNNCPQLKPSKTGNRRCGARGYLQNPPSKSVSYPAYDYYECAQRCFAANPTCVSFGLANTTDYENTVGTCTLYFKKVLDSGFKASQSSNTVYYASFCFDRGNISATPLKDGNFQTGPPQDNKYWTVELFGSTGVSGAHGQHLDSANAFYRDPSSSKGNYEAKLKVYDYGGGSDTYAVLSQTIPLCFGSTYMLTYDEGDGGHFPGNLPAFGIIINNGYYVVEKEDGSDGDIQPRPPAFFRRYFYPPTNTSEIRLLLGMTQYAGLAGSYAEEFVDNLKIQAVYGATVNGQVTDV